ncbi:molybdopterin-dependent oxidoreductase [Sphingomonas sp. MMS24-JH45]
MDGGNPVHAYPRSDRAAEAMKELDLMVAIDLDVTETTRHAHYILPAPTFLERGDCNELWAHNAARPWLQYSPAAIAPCGEARHEQTIYNGLLARLGIADPFVLLIQPGDERPSYCRRRHDAADRAVGRRTRSRGGGDVARSARTRLSQR